VIWVAKLLAVSANPHDFRLCRQQPLRATATGTGGGCFDHADFRRARGEVMARVWGLGWRAALLGDVDRAIAETASRFGPMREG
jgi:hypothetical protein